MDSTLDDLRVEEVDEDGRLWLRLPGNQVLALSIPGQLVPYYQRLIRIDEAYEGWKTENLATRQG